MSCCAPPAPLPPPPQWRLEANPLISCVSTDSQKDFFFFLKKGVQLPTFFLLILLVLCPTAWGGAQCCFVLSECVTQQKPRSAMLSWRRHYVFFFFWFLNVLNHFPMCLDKMSGMCFWQITHIEHTFTHKRSLLFKMNSAYTWQGCPVWCCPHPDPSTVGCANARMAFVTIWSVVWGQKKKVKSMKYIFTRGSSTSSPPCWMTLS